MFSLLNLNSIQFVIASHHRIHNTTARENVIDVSLKKEKQKHNPEFLKPKTPPPPPQHNRKLLNIFTKSNRYKYKRRRKNTDKRKKDFSRIQHKKNRQTRS